MFTVSRRSKDTQRQGAQHILQGTTGHGAATRRRMNSALGVAMSARAVCDDRPHSATSATERSHENNFGLHEPDRGSIW